MVTSRQIVAFRTKSFIPPSLAVTSRKRFWSDLLTAKDIIREIEKNDVEQIVLNKRWKKPVRQKIKKAIRGKYKKVHRNKRNRELEVFIRRDVYKEKR